MLTSTAKRRRKFIESNLGSVRGRVLEIGAFDNPTYRREIGDSVSFLDYFSSDELREKHADNPRRDMRRLVDVDHVIKGADFASSISERFDLVVAHHVIEHVPDAVFWLQQLAALLRPGGHVALSVPDRGYTFDYFRPTTRAAELLRAHEERIDRPTKWHHLDSIYYHAQLDSAALWRGEAPTFQPRFPLPEAIRRAQQASRRYTDTHCWVFTPESFRDVIRELREAEASPFCLRHLATTQQNENEFRALLTP
jgi:SAM-dependent methyltransferase